VPRLAWRLGRQRRAGCFNTAATGGHEKIEMPTIVLKITYAPTGDSNGQVSQSAEPLLRGIGDTDYLCGNFGFVIASGMGPKQHVPGPRHLFSLRRRERIPA
jgi:hypothetical protein